LCGCGARSLDDFREESRGISKTLIQDLKKIHSRDELVNAVPQLKKHFNRLADIMIAAEEWRRKHDEEIPALTAEDHAISDALRAEMSRVCSIEGARELMVSCQEESYKKLESLEN
jgi:3-methyladenine DNA glycosylase Tag